MIVRRAPECRPAGASARLEGRGLHTGQPCAVEFAHIEGPVCLEASGERAQLGQLWPARTDRGVTVRIVGDDEAATGEYAASYQALSINGIQVVTDTTTSKIQHNKFLVIDG